ncbi:MAG: chromate efflux transporter [Hydrogenophaga sp.]|uniref:chromate efflux transporter n=1 Tax=Hydrogenophaga sp. TaxID=1904254 RepID=UPI00275F99B4|nr:chromate efflux transporter [Hydrogenophaga sp.]MDP2417697.1 chromate efflux transporter [Hydrogenophaga sp.]MDZ4187174.1 chromate efflux transporter [Hydrogenophaga sp.]
MPDTPQHWRRVLGVFLVFLRLGCTSFGGPVAHLAFFRTEFVERRRWLDEHRYADLVALCQFLPGPASSQVGMVLGWQRAGWGGLTAAWLGFTLPSALLMVGFAYGVTQLAALQTLPLWQGALQGLKVAAVAVVAQAVWGMARSLCPDAARRALALAAAALALGVPWWTGDGTAWGQLLAMAVSAFAGLVWGADWLNPATTDPSAETDPGFGLPRAAGWVALLLLVAALLGLPLWAAGGDSALLAQVDGFFRAGALVFGGGHVVLPLLQSSVVPSGAVSTTDFLAGYGAAQAMPGPLFAFSAYLGAAMNPAVLGQLAPWQGGALMLLAVFAPALLLVVGLLPFWDTLRQRAGVRTAMVGMNAGVVGLLLAALVNPVWPSAIHGLPDLALAVAALLALLRWRLSPLWVVLGCAGAGALWAWI